MLSQQIDRFSLVTKSIDAAAANTCASDGVPDAPSPFTVAVLNTPLGDLIRDIDSVSELGLFSLTRPQKSLANDHPASVQNAPKVERVPFHGATPLRRQARPAKPSAAPEPEIYLQAATKYISRYHNVRAMPRATAQVDALIDQLHVSRARIAELEQQLASIPTEATSQPKLQADEQQHKLELLQDRVALLKQQRDAVSRHRLAPIQRPAPPAPEPLDDSPENEIGFWNTPTTAGLNFNLASSEGLLLNERVDLPDTSVLLSPQTHPFSSPPQTTRSPSRSPSPSTPRTTLSPHATPEHDSHHSNSPSVASPSPPAPISSPSPPAQPVESKGSPKTNSRIKVTPQVDRITSKVWATVGDILMPGHLNGVTKPLTAKATIACLQNLSSQTSVPPSPSASSASTLSSAPPDHLTLQQVMLAHLLLCLISEPPTHTLSINSAKQALTSKAASMGIASMSQNSTRIIYMCVAKRLLHIDRKRGEQSLRFDLDA